MTSIETLDIILQVDAEKRHLRVPASAPILDVGRAPDNDLVLSEPATLSQRHLLIRWSDGWWVQDTSTNGSSLNGVWFRGCTAALDVDDVLELEGHVLIVHQLDEPVDAEATERKTSIRRLELEDGEVAIWPRQGVIRAPIPPQQYRLLGELLLPGKGGFAPLDRDREFDLLGPLSGEKDPTLRLHQARARLRRWWRTLRREHPRELGDLPADIVRVDGAGLRLTLDVDVAVVEGRDVPA